MRSELKALQRETGISFVFVTHDQDEALAMSDRIAVMQGGRIQQIGRPEEIYEAPANRFVADFIGGANLIPARIGPDGAQAVGLGVIPAAGAVGDAVTLAIRPERLGLVAEVARQPGDLGPLRVVERIYMGNELSFRAGRGRGAVACHPAARRCARRAGFRARRRGLHPAGTGRCSGAGVMKPAWLLTPAIATILIFMALPIAITTVYSVLTPAQYGGVIWEPSPEAYIRLLFERDIFDDSLSFNTDYLKILGRSVLQAGIATILCLIIGLPTAWFIATRPAGQKSFWLMLVTVPYWVNLLVRTIALL